MKQKHLIVVAILLFMWFAALSIFLSNRHQSKLEDMSKDLNDMTVKMDELELQVESLNSQSRIMSSTIKEDELKIKALENMMGPSGSDTAENGDTVKLKWILYSVPSKLNDWPEVEEALNAYSAKKIGVTCDFEYRDMDEVSDILLDPHEYDIAFTSNLWNDFADNVSAGNFRDLTEDLDKYPELKDTALESAWAGTKINDRVYAIPHMKDIGCEVFWILDSNYFLKEKGFEKDLDISFEEIETYLKTYKDDHPDDYPIKVSSAGITSWQMGLVDWLNLDTLIGLEWAAQGTDHETEVKSALEIPAWKDRLRTVHKWYGKGYINPDAPTLDSVPRAESGVVQSGQGWFGAESIWANTIQKPVYISRFDGPYLSTSAIQSMTAVSAYTEHPEEALKLIELMNTDPWYRETARYGIEGRHYIRNVDGTVIRTEEGSNNMSVQAYAQGHVTLGALEASPFPEVPTDIHQWEKTLASYADATVSVAMGFTPDLSTVSPECEEIKKVIAEYKPELYTGASDPDKVIPEMLDKMEKAGLRKVTKEIQRQLDAFLADNRKE